MAVQHFNYGKYWKMRDYIQNYNYTKRVSIKLLWYVFRVKKMDAFANASTGIKIGPGSAVFESHPQLPGRHKSFRQHHIPNADGG